MSFEWGSQPLSIQSITLQYPLPVAIRSAPGFRGSSRPIILHSISRIKFAFGHALRVSKSKNNEQASYSPVDSEIVAVPLRYPGYFECLPSGNNGQSTGIVPEKSIQPIVERMEQDQRPQAFYIASPIRVYTIDVNAEGVTNRTWHTIEAHQIILFDKLDHVEYTPTMDDEITDDDYAFSWWFCFSKSQLLNRNEYVLKCLLSQQKICYIPCLSREEISLIPVGQLGSTNVNKLQSIQNLLEQFTIPLKIKLAQLPGSYAYKDFNGSLQILGSRSEEIAICASLSSSHIAVIPISTPLKFVVATLPAVPSSQIQQILSACHIFLQSFDMQIRRILISSNHDTTSHRARSRYPKIQAAIDDQFKRYKRSYSTEPKSTTTTTTTNDEGYRSHSSTTEKRNNYRRESSSGVNVEGVPQPVPRRRTLSTDDDTAYNSFIHPVQKRKESSSTVLLPPALPKKPANFPYPTTSSTTENGTHLIEVIDSANADGAILIDASNELSLSLPSDSRFT